MGLYPICYPPTVDERVDILDAGGRPTGRIAWKSEAHRDGLWHRCFHLWICDPEGPYLLVQRRAHEKDTWPGYLDVAVAGHLAVGETAKEGVREAEEELGLRVDPERLVSLGTRRIEQDIPAGCDREFHEVFLLLDAVPLRRLRLQAEEVDAVIRFPLAEAERLDAGEEVAAEEWREGRLSNTSISLADFVPKGEGAISLVASAAREAIGGETPRPVFSPF